MNSNTKRKLENLAKFIEKLPRKAFNIDYWMRTEAQKKDSEISYNVRFSKKDAKQESHCNTQCCIAGWQVVRKGLSVEYGGATFKGKKLLGYASDVAANQLGLDSYDAHRLFYPNDLINVYGYSKFPNTPKGAAKRIRHFIETGE